MTRNSLRAQGNPVQQTRALFSSAPAILFALLFLAACQSPFERTGPKFDIRKSSAAAVTNAAPITLTNQVAPEWLQPVSEPFTLGPGDKIDIEVLGDAGTHTTVTVGPDGRIYFFLIPGLDVWGLTLAQTRERIEGELSKYMAGAQVAVTLRSIESKRIWLLGRLHNSGVYPISGPVTLLESISAAGGLLSPGGPAAAGTEELADLERSFVVRDGQLIPVDFNRLIKHGDMSQNIYLRPGDFVYVPSASSREVYVLGAVHIPRPLGAGQAKTLVSAIANVGGTIKDAYLTHVGIVRGSLSQPKIAIVNYKDIVAGKAPDVRLEPQDIVYVPFHPYRNVFKYADLILATFTRAVAINEGARAVDSSIPPVGINIGVGLK